MRITDMKQVRLNNGVMLVSPTATASAWSATSIRPATCRAGSRPSPSAAPMERSRSSHRVCMPRFLPSVALSHLLLTRHTAAKAEVSLAISHPARYIPMITAQRLTTLMLQPEVDMNRIGILGICGFGQICVNAAVQDTRIKATVSSTMGAFDPYDKEQRYELRRQLNELRTADLLAGRVNERSGGVPTNLPDDAEQFWKDYRDYYKTSRGYHPRSTNSNGGWEKIADLPFLTNSLLDHADEIHSAVLIIHGDKAYSLPASKAAYAKLTGDNKELMIIPGASHTDLYDNLDKIPFDRIVEFYRAYLI